MDKDSKIDVLTPFLFFGVAAIYSTVGFGGGSSYIAILALSGIFYQHIPLIALLCNILVVSGNLPHFIRSGQCRWSLVWPFLLSSIPFAYLGGRIPISKDMFMLVLGVSLGVVGLMLLGFDRIPTSGVSMRQPRKLVSILIGSVLGIVSGLVGIGGGVFLSPLLLFFKWGTPKQVAASSSIFILVNSIFGLIGQLSKGSSELNIESYVPLFLAVVLGGQLGSYVMTEYISQKTVKVLTACLVLFVSVRLLFI